MSRAKGIATCLERIKRQKFPFFEDSFYPEDLIISELRAERGRSASGIQPRHCRSHRCNTAGPAERRRRVAPAIPYISSMRIVKAICGS